MLLKLTEEKIMEYKINAELVAQVLNVIAGAKNVGISFLELNALIKQLQQLPKISEPVKPVDADKKK